MIRRTPLLRTTGLVTRTPLVRHAPMPRGASLGRSGGLRGAATLERRTRLRYRSKKMSAVYVTRREVVADLLERFPICQVKWDQDCRLLSEDIHEPRKRSQGADICDPAECIAACRYCHDAIHGNVAEAERRGWLIRSGRPSKAVPR